MRKYWIALAVLPAFLAGAAQAQQRKPVAEVAAALTLASEGVRSQNASLIVTGLEILAFYAPVGRNADALYAEYVSEAQLLLRGNSGLQTRLRSVGATRKMADTRDAQIRIFSFAKGVAVPEGLEVRTVAATRGALLRALYDADGQACVRRLTEWDCAFAPAGGVLSADGYAPDTAWLVADINPARP